MMAGRFGNQKFRATVRPAVILGLIVISISATSCRESSTDDQVTEGEVLEVANGAGESPTVGAIEALIDPEVLDSLQGRRAASRRFRVICYHLEVARRQGEEPVEIIQRAQDRLGMRDTARADSVRDSLIRSLRILEELGCLDDAGMAKLKKGSAPMITKGSYAGDIASVDLIIPRSVCDELDEKLFNLEFAPSKLCEEMGNKVSKRQIKLARTWYARGVLSKEGMDKVLAAEKAD